MGMYINTCVHTYLHACILRYIRAYLHTCKHVHVHIHVYIYICMYICIYVYMYMYICIYVYMYMYICIYVYMYICIYVYMYMYMYMYGCVCVCTYKYVSSVHPFAYINIKLLTCLSAYRGSGVPEISFSLLKSSLSNLLTHDVVSVGHKRFLILSLYRSNVFVPKSRNIRTRTKKKGTPPFTESCNFAPALKNKEVHV